MCFIMKIKFYHTAPYADELRTVAEYRIVDIMDEQIDDWVAVTFLLSQLPFNYTPHLFNGDRSLSGTL